MRVDFELLAEMPRVDAKIVVAAFGVWAPHGPQEGLVGAGPSSIRKEHFDQPELGWG